MKLWQTASSSEPLQLVEQFTAGADVRLDEVLWRYDIWGSLAHAEMLYQIGILSKSERDEICRALSQLAGQPVDLTPADEDVHTKLENLLIEQVGEAGKKIHTARSRNDQVLVTLRLFCKEKLIEICEAQITLGFACLQLAQKHEWQPMPGYTHTRTAMLSSVGLWAGALAESLLEDLGLVDAVYTLVDRNPLGASAGYGVPLKIDRDLTSELLGFGQTQKNTLAVMNSRGKIEFALLAALSATMLDVGRFASDLILFSSDEYGFVELPADFCTGSSIMPHKRNPDVLELVRARTSSVLAALTQHALILKGLTSGYHRDLQETKRTLFEGLSTTLACLSVMIPLISGIKVNEKRLDAALTPEIFAVDEMLGKVKSGASLRDAYRQVKERLDNLTGRDPKQALKERSHVGGPGSLDLGELQQRLKQHQSSWVERRRAFGDRLRRLLELGA